MAFVIRIRGWRTRRNERKAEKLERRGFSKKNAAEADGAWDDYTHGHSPEDAWVRRADQNFQPRDP